MRALLAAWLVFVAASAQAQSPPTTILFVGNSFTYGGSTAVYGYNTATVTDENATQPPMGGIPAIFKKFADEAGLSYEVHVELVGGKNLEYHYQHSLPVIAQAKWDAVVLQGYSTEALPAARDGEPESFVANAIRLEKAVHAAKPAAKIYLYETWAYPFKTYPQPGTHDRGPLDQMTDDLHAGYGRAFAEDKHFEAVAPVGDTWKQAAHSSVATYDVAAPGRLLLLDKDHKHPSVAGSYLAALVLFEQITGKDATALGADEQAARDLGLSREDAAKLQAVATGAFTVK